MQEMTFLHAEKTEKTPSVFLEKNPLPKVSFLLKKITAANHPSSNEFLLQSSFEIEK